jgi:hypothetical protein
VLGFRFEPQGAYLAAATRQLGLLVEAGCNNDPELGSVSSSGARADRAARNVQRLDAPDCGSTGAFLRPKFSCEAIPAAESSKEFAAAANELFQRIMQMTDNAGATDDHRALNYLVVRYPAVMPRWQTPLSAMRR